MNRSSERREEEKSTRECTTSFGVRRCRNEPHKVAIDRIYSRPHLRLGASNGRRESNVPLLIVENLVMLRVAPATQQKNRQCKRYEDCCTHSMIGSTDTAVTANRRSALSFCLLASSLVRRTADYYTREHRDTS